MVSEEFAALDFVDEQDVGLIGPAVKDRCEVEREASMSDLVDELAVISMPFGEMDREGP